MLGPVYEIMGHEAIEAVGKGECICPPSHYTHDRFIANACTCRMQREERAYINLLKIILPMLVKVINRLIDRHSVLQWVYYGYSFVHLSNFVMV